MSSQAVSARASETELLSYLHKDGWLPGLVRPYEFDPTVLKKAQGEESSELQSECAQLLEENKKDEVLKKLVTSSASLSGAPEKGKHSLHD